MSRLCGCLCLSDVLVGVLLSNWCLLLFVLMFVSVFV